jgi:hypothetical protein
LATITQTDCPSQVERDLSQMEKIYDDFGPDRVQRLQDQIDESEVKEDD